VWNNYGGEEAGLRAQRLSELVDTALQRLVLDRFIRLHVKRIGRQQRANRGFAQAGPAGIVCGWKRPARMDGADTANRWRHPAGLLCCAQCL
jgi:hypothetical protein